jgi:hypothetical protein
MADMYGAYRSNWFRVKDGPAFKVWFEENVYYPEMDTWVEKGGDGSWRVAFGGECQYPSAWPSCRGDEINDPEPWDPDAFGWAIREHLAEGETFCVTAAGNEKLRYVQATQFRVTPDGKHHFLELYSGNDGHAPEAP